MSEVYEIDVNRMPPNGLRGNARWGGGKRARMTKWRTEQDWKKVGFGDGWDLLNEIGQPIAKAKITYVFHKRGVMDIENFVTGMKYYMDGLVASGLFHDDNSQIILPGESRHERLKGKDAKPYTKVIIEVLGEETQ